MSPDLALFLIPSMTSIRMSMPSSEFWDFQLGPFWAMAMWYICMVCFLGATLSTGFSAKALPTVTKTNSRSIRIIVRFMINL